SVTIAKPSRRSRGTSTTLKACSRRCFSTGELSRYSVGGGAAGAIPAIIVGRRAQLSLHGRRARDAPAQEKAPSDPAPPRGAPPYGRGREVHAWQTLTGAAANCPHSVDR